MKFPEKNSRGERILKAFMAGPMTIYQGAEAHGEFATLFRPDGIDHAKMVELYCDLVDRGCLVREGILFRLATRAHDRLKMMAHPEPARPVVPPRVKNFLMRALYLGYDPAAPRRIAL